MKKVFFLLIFFFSFRTINAQDSINISKNEFGIDVTGFVFQVLHLNADPFPSKYLPQWHLTYRRHLTGKNLRAGFALSYISYKRPSLDTNDIHTYKYVQSGISLRGGCEWFTEIGKRWQVFYGADASPSITYDQDDADNFNAGYANGRTFRATKFSISPLLGFRFRITNRLSLSTETSLSFVFTRNRVEQYFTPVNAQYVPIAGKSWKNSEYAARFNQPLSVFFTFDI